MNERERAELALRAWCHRGDCRQSDVIIYDLAAAQASARGDADRASQFTALRDERAAELREAESWTEHYRGYLKRIATSEVRT